MSEILVSPVEPQEMFPYEDASDSNAQYLSLMLANKLLVDTGHKAAEETNWAYRVGHPSIERSAQRIYDVSYIDAISHGVALLEAMNVYLNGMYADRSDTLVVNQSAFHLVAGATEAELRDETLGKLDEFKHQMPRTTEVIADASQRFFGPFTEYAVLGAAIQRGIIIKATKEIDE